MPILTKLISNPFRGNIASPPVTPKIEISVVEHAEHPADREPLKMPPKLITLPLPVIDFMIFL